MAATTSEHTKAIDRFVQAITTATDELRAALMPPTPPPPTYTVGDLVQMASPGCNPIRHDAVGVVRHVINYDTLGVEWVGPAFYEGRCGHSLSGHLTGPAGNRGWYVAPSEVRPY